MRKWEFFMTIKLSIFVYAYNSHWHKCITIEKRKYQKHCFSYSTQTKSHFPMECERDFEIFKKIKNGKMQKYHECSTHHQSCKQIVISLTTKSNCCILIFLINNNNKPLYPWPKYRHKQLLYIIENTCFDFVFRKQKYFFTRNR